MKRPLWFRRKRYGWGWYPANWKGWLIIGIYLAGLATIFRDVDSTSHSNSDTLIGVFLPALGLTAILLLITVLTGEKPRWQWGEKNEE